jgi:hypothetical protein
MMQSNTAYLVLFLIAAVVGTAVYFVFDALLALEGAGNVLAYGTLLAVGVLAALAVTAIARRWDWFLPVALGAILAPAVLKVLDDLSGLAISAALGGAGSILVSLLYGLLAAAGAVAGLVLMANRRTARRTRL